MLHAARLSWNRPHIGGQGRVTYRNQRLFPGAMTPSLAKADTASTRDTAPADHPSWGLLCQPARHRHGHSHHRRDHRDGRLRRAPCFLPAGLVVQLGAAVAAITGIALLGPSATAVPRGSGRHLSLIFHRTIRRLPRGRRSVGCRTCVDGMESLSMRCSRRFHNACAVPRTGCLGHQRREGGGRRRHGHGRPRRPARPMNNITPLQETPGGDVP